MVCEHKRIMSRNCVLICTECGAELPPDFLTGKHSPAKQDAPEGQEKAAKKTTRKRVKASGNPEN